ncbi:DUF2326 domain-containing protein [Dyadobacter chenhuakuii]|uniref:DUF2326 domain-containing protein n=1 Tax=Dyadobacter chenhuakuii TaxID=2909339 RepID=A0A9X1U2R4_9BACT|nr:DUF2326 domain-containing protein [Dyadobacter chenhuakuii]MCF2500816.1 DUF2326 domain-containing protein [Dyadobacter chenhuakuii]
MFLTALYSEPGSLFEPVRFKDGINYIFGKKDADNSRDSLNGVGKSTTLELVDFCLGADFNAKSTSRLFKEVQKLKDFYIVLEFEVEGMEYLVRRSVDSPRKLEIGDVYSTNEYDLKEAKQKLFDIIFRDLVYEGVLQDSWYRSLIGFYLKVHKKQKNEFVDPIQYLTSASKIYELNQYHLYLMGIDNRLVCRNSDLQNSVKDRDAALREVKRLIESNYGVGLKEANKRLDRLKNEISKASGLIESFKLAQQHKNVEEQLDNLTKKIKLLSEANFWDNSRLTNLRASAEFKDDLSTSKINGIERMYAEMSRELGAIVKKTLKDAIEFRKKLSKSRESFLKEELDKLTRDIALRNQEIENFDSQRAELFKSLKVKSAFKDLTEAYLYVGRLNKDFVDLRSKVDTYKELEESKAQWRAKDAQIAVEFKTFLGDISDEIAAFGKTFSEVYDSIYSASQSSGFSITQSFSNSKQKVDINVSFESEESKGWNKGRTLVYDLAVMLNSIKRNLKRPRFLVHDGIFDGMDKAHFVELIAFVEKCQEDGNRFQYIITLNEEGTLTQNFGIADDLTAHKIASQAISVLTPKKKFWTSGWQLK